MPHLLTQTEFDTAAAAWLAFIGRASAGEVQALFQTRPTHKHEHHPRQYQTYVRFDLATTIPYLLSTVGIAQVAARFVLVTSPSEIVPAPPRFRVVLYATDQLGGRISAYYLGDSEYHLILPTPKPTPKPGPTPPDAGYDVDPMQGLVPFSLISNWLTAWVTAATHQHLKPAMFATSSYGPLQGYVFEIGDFMDQLFSAPERGSTQLYLNFGLKTYFPAHPEKLTEPAQTFGLVVRLYTPTAPPPPKAGDTSAAIEAEQRSVADLLLGAAAYVSGTDGSESGPSYDMAQPYPPG
jgi:hypothetical protein